MDVMSLRNSDIRLRGDDISLKTYINRRYPTVRCSDPYHECDYTMRLILMEELEDEEEMHVIRHHEMFKSLLQESPQFLTTLFTNVHSWMKHFLYDPSHKFDLFSSYEIQLIFLTFLNAHGLLRVSHEESPWLSFNSDSCTIDSSNESLELGRLFIDFLFYLASP
jgi:hypothetical protein